MTCDPGEHSPESLPYRRVEDDEQVRGSEVVKVFHEGKCDVDDGIEPGIPRSQRGAELKIISL